VIFLQDAENHSDYCCQSTSANVAILEKSNTNELSLRYHAATTNDASFVVGKILTRKMKNVRYI
jgi:hypothetical protein